MLKQGQLNIRENIARHLAAALGIKAGEGRATIYSSCVMIPFQPSLKLLDILPKA